MIKYYYSLRETNDQYYSRLHKLENGKMKFKSTYSGEFQCYISIDLSHIIKEHKLVEIPEHLFLLWTLL